MTLRRPLFHRAPDSNLVRLLTSLSLLLFVCWGCRQVPVSGRRALNPNLPVVGMSEAEEIQLGLTSYQDVLQKEPISQNARYNEIVKRVGQRIAAVADRPDYDWEFTVIAKDVQNAFALPGGKVAIYEGILPVCQSEAGLAVVMSHEIAHALARHGGERMAQQKIKNLGSIGIDAVGKWKYGEDYDKHQKIVQTAYGYGAELGAILPYSRKHESEADLIGIELMAKAGYDPSEAPLFWERFSAAKGGESKMEFFSTHPADARRAADLRAALPSALQLYDAAPQKHGIGDRLVLVESTNITLPLTADTQIR